jgi:hypothetical protein
MERSVARPYAVKNLVLRARVSAWRSHRANPNLWPNGIACDARGARRADCFLPAMSFRATDFVRRPKGRPLGPIHRRILGASPNDPLLRRLVRRYLREDRVVCQRARAYGASRLFNVRFRQSPEGRSIASTPDRCSVRDRRGSDTQRIPWQPSPGRSRSSSIHAEPSQKFNFLSSGLNRCQSIFRPLGCRINEAAPAARSHCRRIRAPAQRPPGNGLRRGNRDAGDETRTKVVSASIRFCVTNSLTSLFQPFRCFPWIPLTPTEYGLTSTVSCQQGKPVLARPLVGSHLLGKIELKASDFNF